MLRVDIPSRDGSFVFDSRNEIVNRSQVTTRVAHIGRFLILPNAKEQYATIEEVQAALPSDVPGLSVDDGLRYPCVAIP